MNNWIIFIFILLNIVLAIIESTIRKKEIRWIHIGKEEIQLSIFAGDMIMYEKAQGIYKAKQQQQSLRTNKVIQHSHCIQEQHIKSFEFNWWNNLYFKAG